MKANFRCGTSSRATVIVLMLALLNACATTSIDQRADGANNENETYDAVSSATSSHSDGDAKAASADWIVLMLLAIVASVRRQTPANLSSYPRAKQPAAASADTQNDA
ncbi:MAG: hypothetical protein JSU67_10675 [Gammaproteobacteria bacterium]|nr:MAG: hypothetical protein JSU67_10675 [Gammaproteobacteria bacterium]